MRSLCLLWFAIAACGSPSEAPPLGPRSEPLLPSPTIPTPDAGITASLPPGGALGFTPDRPRALPLVEAPVDAGMDALLPPFVPRLDGGLVPDAGGLIAPPHG